MGSASRPGANQLIFVVVVCCCVHLCRFAPCRLLGCHADSAAEVCWQREGCKQACDRLVLDINIPSIPIVTVPTNCILSATSVIAAWSSLGGHKRRRRLGTHPHAMCIGELSE
jgi:hypothetical protein